MALQADMWQLESEQELSSHSIADIHACNVYNIYSSVLYQLPVLLVTNYICDSLHSFKKQL